MAQIESIEAKGKNKYEIHLEDGVDFVLYKSEVRKFGLEVGLEVGDDLFADLLREVFIPRAKSRAMHLLEKKDYAKRELGRKLSMSGYPREAVDEAVAYVESFGYVDDERLCKSYIHYYESSKSRMRIKQDLLKKGVDRDLIEECLESELEQSQEELIERLLQKKHYDRELSDRAEREKMFRYLAQRGFDSADISRALRGEYS